MNAYWPPLMGGMLLGVSASILLLLNGRVAGISGIVGGLLKWSRVLPSIAFIAGLLCGPFVYALAFGTMPTINIAASVPLILTAGLLVGIGTRMGSGCTSGHGIVGLARFSKRSFAATATFLATGVATATLIGFLS